MKHIFKHTCALALAIVMLSNTSQAQQINGAEYFFDTDPGVGNATSITIATAADSVDVSNIIPTTGLSIGFHNLFIRTRSTNGLWSLYEGRNLYINPPAPILPPQEQITKAEYFFDADPGLGNGTSIVTGAVADSIDISKIISTTSLAAGFHNLFIRTKNVNGSWSLYEGRNFYINPPAPVPPAQAKIVEAEYFFDTDPGVGNASAIVTGAAADSIDATKIISTASVAPGFHNLFIRTKNVYGIWSLYEGRNFYVNAPAPTALQSQLVAAEYFFDADPGVGNGLAVTPGFAQADTVDETTIIPQSFAMLSQHTVSIRVKNTVGRWSLQETRSFFICDTIGPAGAIAGVDSVAACVNQNAKAYSTAPIFNAQYYVWTLPPGASIVSGDSTNSIVVNYSAYSQSGNVTVAGGRTGGCVGVSSSFAVYFKPIPVAEICHATVDSLTQKTIIEWQKPTENYIDGYVIFREKNALFTAIDTVSNLAFSSYLDSDTGSHPELHPEKYKIAVLDSCGNTGDISSSFEHQTIHLYGSLQPGGIAKLYWTDYIGVTDPNRYYRVMRDDTGNGPFTVINTTANTSTRNYTDLASPAFPNCRYVIDLMADVNCTPSQRISASKSTSRSNIKNRFGLYDSTSVNVTLLDRTNFEVRIYPNPAKDAVNIEVWGQQKNLTVKINNLLGQTIGQKQIEIRNEKKSRVQIPLQTITPGIYFVTVENENMKRVFKLQVE